MIDDIDSARGPRVVRKGDAALGARYVLLALRDTSRRMGRMERRLAYKSLAREVPVVLRELEAQRTLLRDVMGAIERGEVMAKYVRRIGEMLPEGFDEKDVEVMA